MRKDRMRTFLALFLTLALAMSLIALAGCDKKEDSATEDGETSDDVTVDLIQDLGMPDVIAEMVVRELNPGDTIKIGMVIDLSGTLADYGFTGAEGAKLAAADNTSVTIDGNEYPVELVIRDDKGEPAEAPVAAQGLVDEGCVIVLGALTSSNTNAVMPIFAENGVVQLSASATLASLTQLGNEAFFRNVIGDQFQGPELADWAEELGLERVVIMDDRGDYSVGLANEVVKALQEKGIEMIRVQCQEGDTDFSAQIANMKEFDPDGIIFTGYHPEAGLVRKQMVEAGLGDVVFMGGDGIKSPEIVEEAGGEENATGMLCTVGGISYDDMPGYEAYLTRYEDEVGKAASTYSEGWFDLMGIAVQAVSDAGSINTEDLITALRDMEYDGVIGTYGFDEMGEMELAGAGITTVNRFELTGEDWESAS